MSLELRPCPFCNGPASLHNDTEGGNFWYVYCVGDKYCPQYCATPYALPMTPEEAVERWNRRADSEAAHQRDLLGQAIVDAALKAGIIRPDADVSGPMLLMLCDDLATAATSED